MVGHSLIFAPKMAFFQAYLATGTNLSASARNVFCVIKTLWNLHNIFPYPGDVHLFICAFIYLSNPISERHHKKQQLEPERCVLKSSCPAGLSAGAEERMCPVSLGMGCITGSFHKVERPRDRRLPVGKTRFGTHSFSFPGSSGLINDVGKVSSTQTLLP